MSISALMPVRTSIPWLLAVLLTVVVAFGTKLGPIVVNFAGPHGVHLGDVAVLAVGAACAAVASTSPAVRAANG